jgi:hypothetical protein
VSTRCEHGTRLPYCPDCIDASLGPCRPKSLEEQLFAKAAVSQSEARALRQERDARAAQLEEARRRIDDLLAGRKIDDEDYSRALQENKQLRESLQASEAQAAVLREALAGLPCYAARGEPTYECRHDSLCPACAARHALQPGAGSSLLAEVEALRRVAESAQMVTKHHRGGHTLYTADLLAALETWKGVRGG